MWVKLMIVDVSNIVELAHASSVVKPGKVCFVYIDERGARKLVWRNSLKKTVGSTCIMQNPYLPLCMHI